ncbi:hypothetical protein HJFPF1_02654 [Paramyrothecium foliicola]|nr:hypothetical protein HJFPF1_02654 [Paramyrothecium foliicola]
MAPIAAANKILLPLEAQGAVTAGMLGASPLRMHGGSLQVRLCTRLHEACLFLGLPESPVDIRKEPAMLKPGVILALAAAAVARKCHNITVPISISSRNAVFGIKPPLTEIEATNFFLNIARQGFNYTDKVTEGYTTCKGDYDIAATYCEPDDGPGRVLQILTHGIGFDRSYWDFSYNNYNYSYVDRAVDDAGYSTFSWDRLGIGSSSHGDPVSEIQVFLEIAALKELTSLVTGGKINGIEATYPDIVHVGHSFGSVITYNLVNESPDLSSGIVLTGFSQVPNYLSGFALGSNFVPVAENPVLATKYPAGYLAPKSSIGVHIDFFAESDFDPRVLDVAAQTGQPVTPGEILTVGAGTGLTNSFRGPVLIITGEKDIPFCGGNCLGTSAIDNKAPNLIEASAQYFPKASTFNATVVPGAGHGLNIGYSHISTYDDILDFISTNV